MHTKKLKIESNALAGYRCPHRLLTSIGILLFTGFCYSSSYAVEDVEPRVQQVADAATAITEPRVIGSRPRADELDYTNVTVETSSLRSAKEGDLIGVTFSYSGQGPEVLAERRISWARYMTCGASDSTSSIRLYAIGSAAVMSEVSTAFFLSKIIK